jgi:drug/metabolite transporter (DMT)-like permease
MVDLPLGLFIGISAGAMWSIGTALQKKAAVALPKIETQSGKQNIKNFLSNKIWLLGWILTTIQWYIALFAMPLLPLSLFSSLMGVNLTILAIFSYFYLKEPITWKERGGIVAIITGVVVLGLTTQEQSGTISLVQMGVYIGSFPAITYTMILFIGVTTPILLSRARKYAYGDITFGITTGFLMAIGQIYSKAIMSGFVEGEVLLATISNLIWWIWILLVGIGNIGSMVTMQFGFQKGKAVIVATLAQVLALVLGVLGGIIIFNEWDGLALEIIGIKLTAVGAILVGIVILSLRTKNPTPNQASQTTLSSEENKQ